MRILEESNKLARKRLILVLVVSFVVMVFVAALSYANFVYTKNNAINRIIYSELPWLSQKIEAQINATFMAPLTVSKDMAKDPWLKSWLENGEKDVSSIAQKLVSAKAAHGMLTAFVVSDKSANYYNEDGLHKKLDASKDSHDKWFYGFKEYAKSHDYEVVADTSQANKDKLTIFINYALRSSDETFLAAVGFGLMVDDFGKKIQEFKSGRSDIQLWLVDENGDIKLSENGKNIAICSDKSGKFSLKNTFGEQNAKDILRNNGNVVKIESNGTKYVVSRYIKELKWYIVVKVDEDSVVSGLNKEFLQNEAIFSFIMLLLAGIGVWQYNRSWMHKERTMLRLSAIFDSSTLGICVINKKMRFIELNGAISKMLDMDGDALKQRSFLDLVAEDKKEFLKFTVTALFESKVESEAFTMELLGANEKKVFVQITLSAVLDYMGKVDFVYAILEDVTQKHLLEEQKRRQEDLLIQQSKMAALGEMIDMVAHQWKQPLNALSMSLQELALMNDLNELKPEDVKASCNANINIVHDMGSTLDDFRGFFNPVKQKTAFNLKKATQKVLDILKRSMVRHGVSVAVDVDEGIVCFGVANELQQVLLSLVSNAKDVLEVGSVAEKIISIKATRSDDGVLICVSDNGGGIPEGFLEKIFAPRFSMKENGGTGVGLYLSRLIIEDSFHGKIWAENVGDGASFYILIPVD